MFDLVLPVGLGCGVSLLMRKDRPLAKPLQADTAHESAARQTAPEVFELLVIDIDRRRGFQLQHSLAAPLTEKTKGLINRSAIDQMKEDVFIINTARGAMIDEDDLYAAAKSRRIRGAALDCFEEEPLVPGHPLLTLDNVTVSPHIAGVSDRSLLNMGMSSARNTLAVLRGEALDPLVVKNSQCL